MPFQITPGEMRILRWISARIKKLDKNKDLVPDTKYRGFHVFGVQYSSEWPKCEWCNQAIRSDKNLAYSMFVNATVFWDGEQITHDQLRDNLLGIVGSEAVDSKCHFRNPSEYGIDPVREWMRRELGLNIVIVDLDYAVRRYGTRFGLDSEGDLMLIEKKEVWPKN